MPLFASEDCTFGAARLSGHDQHALRRQLRAGVAQVRLRGLRSRCVERCALAVGALAVGALAFWLMSLRCVTAYSAANGMGRAYHAGHAPPERFPQPTPWYARPLFEPWG
jgi:hypothetical protein